MSSAQVWDKHTVNRELAADVLRNSGMVRLRAAGWSMLPTVWPDDILVVEQLTTDVCEGDIVAFSRGGRFVAHRVVTNCIASEGTIIQTRGDALLQLDSPVSCAELMGKVVLISRNGRGIEPGRILSFGERTFAALLRRSPLAVRITVRVYEKLKIAFHSNFDNRAVSCQS